MGRIKLVDAAQPSPSLLPSPPPPRTASHRRPRARFPCLLHRLRSIDASPPTLDAQLAALRRYDYAVPHCDAVGAAPATDRRRPSASGPCRASPDGRYVAALGASAVSVYATGSLRLVNVVKLPPELQGPVCAFLWAPSSTRLLVATAEHIHVFAAIGSPFCAAIRNPGCAAAAGKPPLIYFGASHDEVLVCCVFGLKLTAFRLSTSTAVEIANPKFHHAPSATRGFAVRPGTGHLAVLTRVGGKDMLSIHHPRTRSVERSWSPESVDAQGIMWTPDGKWLLLWESWAQGHRLMLHTPDGQHFRTIGPASLSHEQALGPDRGLELGFKACQTSPDARLCALGDCSRGVTVLCTKSWRESMRLLHPATIVPRDTMQVRSRQQHRLLPMLPRRSRGLTRLAQGVARAVQLHGPGALHALLCAHDANGLTPCLGTNRGKADCAPEPWLLARRIRLVFDALGHEA